MLKSITKFSLLFFFIFFLSWNHSFAQLTVIDGKGFNINRILKQLVGDGVTVSNVTVNCKVDAYGRYTYTGTGLPLDSGIIMSTGRIIDAIGPNTAADETQDPDASGELGNPGDTQLTNLFGVETADACTIEFDVIPIGNEIKFNYTFASEEYREYSGCPGSVGAFSDVFAFFVSGVNPSGGNYTDLNIAKVPNTNTEVSVTQVNHCRNPLYYEDNFIGSPHLRYDGYTVDLVAQIAVKPCSTYHFKLKIADASDELFDSAVFISEINSNVPDLSANIDEVIEGCTTADLEISRLRITNAESFQIAVAGTATPLVDYDISLNGSVVTNYPFLVNFPVGQAIRNLTFISKDDIENDANETVRVYLKSACSGAFIDSVDINILSKEQIKPVASLVDTFAYRCRPAEIIELEARLSDSYTWTSTNGSFDCIDADCRKIKVNTIDTPSEYKLVIGLGICTFEETVTVNPAFLNLTENQTICIGQTAQLLAEYRDTYSWTPTTGLSCVDCANPIASPSTTTTYTVTGTKANCTDQKSVTVTVIQNQGPQFSNLANQYCINDAPFNLAATPTGGNFTIGGNAATQFNPATLGEGSFEVIYKIGLGANCSEIVKKTVQINILPIVSIDNLLNEYCISESVFNLSASPIGGSFKVNGQTATSFSPTTLGAGDFEVIYTYTNPATNCSNSASKMVKVKPLPQLEFINVPDSYCVSENMNIPATVKITEFNGTTQNVVAQQINPATLGVGNFTINFTHLGLNGCSNSIQKTITINPIPELSFTNLLSEYCQQALGFNLQAMPSGGIFKVNGVTANELVPNTFQIGDRPIITYTYTDAKNCSNEISQEILITPATGFESSETDLLICPPEFGGYDLVAIDPNSVNIGYTYFWSPNGETSEKINFTEDSPSGVYTVLVRDELSCPVAFNSFNVTIDCVPKLFIPTAFSPNGDPLNNTLKIFGKDFSDLDLKIYNRWGEVVFTANSKEDEWNGMVGGKDAPEGVYVWKASFINILQPDKVISMSGRITLVR